MTDCNYEERKAAAGREVSGCREDVFDDKAETEACEEEIKITPEMIAAGGDAFCSYDSRWDDVEDVVIRIWLAMKRA